MSDAAPPVEMKYRQRNVWARWRLRLTMLGMIALPFLSWRWVNTEMARWSLPLGIIIVVAGVAMRLWAAGWLRKNEALATDGPYAVVRHPLYLGTGLIALGQGLMSAVPLATTIFPLLWLALYLPVMREEEAFLRERYGAQYDEYRRRVRALWPRIGAQSTFQSTLGSDAGDFSWLQAWRNREYEALIVNAIFIVIYVVLHAARR